MINLDVPRTAPLPPGEQPGTASTFSAFDAASLPAERPSRVVVELARPLIDGGRFAAKASQGSPLIVEADVFADGHDPAAASCWIWHDSNADWEEVPMRPIGNDRFRAEFTPSQIGMHFVSVMGWVDHFSAWKHKLRAELEADTGGSTTETSRAKYFDATIALTLQDAEAMFRHAETLAGDDADAASVLADARQACATASIGLWLTQPELEAAMRRYGRRHPVGRSSVMAPVWVDRPLALFGAWYEFFPRSIWDRDAARTGGRLDDLEGQLDHAAGMGFDVVYLPPIHPIGEVNRKGPNNSTTVESQDKGSPWAIGSSAGGHCSIDPALGNDDDLRRLVSQAESRGLELALDIAFQCAPDHPWVESNPQWFRHRADGSIRYAENPPKRYEDIVPLDFETEDWEALWHELRNVIWHWIDHGIQIFRVDNPHTKAFAFWEWCIATTRQAHPEVIFLAEAFTRPRVMERLAKLGFTQSYTYFTWRQTSEELQSYGIDLAERTIDYLRPNFWPNTPDILTEELQHGGRSAFVARAVLAATLSPLWGIYGPAFELVERTPVRAGSEEYLDSEKYQPRHWDLEQPHSLAPFITLLNTIRRDQPALQHLEGLRFHPCTNPALVCFTKPNPTSSGGVLVVVNTDHEAQQGGIVDVDWAAISLAYESTYHLTDQLGGEHFTWHGPTNYVELDGDGLNAHIFTVDGPSAESPS